MRLRQIRNNETDGPAMSHRQTQRWALPIGVNDCRESVGQLTLQLEDE